ncbi:MAG TPA: MBL fold metallo-hydrolase [Candidatus Barnesiella merdipullorum]|nr:MBL fold metallo-hydrolase [Candidatus Barnesiella merdipullorum]
MDERMKLTYLFHSGFLLEADGFAIVFDYYRGGEAILDEVLRRQQPLYVLVSHEHRDHYNPEILTWSRSHGRICYLFPREMAGRKELATLSNAVFLSRGESYADERLRVTAFGSTDLGASYEVETGGRTIFHAGDLNNWHWIDESTEAEVHEAEEAYRAELDYLAREVERFDVAMFPVDARLGSDYMRGARQFVERFEVGLFVPMHFYPATAKAEAFAPIARQHGAEFVLLSHTGDSVTIK